MKVSIITPSYQQGRFIQETLQSVASQDGCDVEHLVFDGGSTDNTVDILKNFTLLSHWESKKDSGQTDALNQGIRFSNGEIIGWLNSDDIYYPDAIANVVRFFKTNPDVDVVYGMADHIDINGLVIDSYPTQPWNYERLKENCFICQPALFFRRRIIEAHGLFDEKLNYCMDYEYWLRLGHMGVVFHYLENKLAGSRMYSTNKTLGSKLNVHKEINNMFTMQFGCVPDQWLFGYVHVVMGKRFGPSMNRPKLVSIEFIIRCVIYSLYWNRGISSNMKKILFPWSKLFSIATNYIDKLAK